MKREHGNTMTDENTAEMREQEEKENELQTVISEPPIDIVLELLVTVGNCGLGLPVTLFVKGVMVTGNIISFEDYMKKTADNIRSSTNLTEMDEEISREVTESIAKRFDTIRTDSLQRGGSPRMIHLDNVKIFNQNGNFIDISNALWRGALGSIDGWILGTLSRTE